MIAAAVTAGARDRRRRGGQNARPAACQIRSRGRGCAGEGGRGRTLVALLAVVAFASLAVSVTAAGLDVGVGHLAAAAAAAGLLGLLYGSIALAVGAAAGGVGSRSPSPAPQPGPLRRERARFARRRPETAAGSVALLSVRRRRPAPPWAHVRARHSPSASARSCSSHLRSPLRETRPRVVHLGEGLGPSPGCPRYLTTVIASRIARQLVAQRQAWRVLRIRQDGDHAVRRVRDTTAAALEQRVHVDEVRTRAAGGDQFMTVSPLLLKPQP